MKQTTLLKISSFIGDTKSKIRLNVLYLLMYFDVIKSVLLGKDKVSLCYKKRSSAEVKRLACRFSNRNKTLSTKLYYPSIYIFWKNGYSQGLYIGNEEEMLPF